MLTGRLEKFASLLFEHYQPNWRPSERLGGRDSSGKAWKTARAKAYPPLLCKAIEEAHLHYAEAMVCEAEDEEPTGLREALEALAQQYDPYRMENKGCDMKGDYWGLSFAEVL